MRGANTVDVDLVGADLRGANLKGTKLQVDRTTVQADEHTVWPEELLQRQKRERALLKREAEKKAAKEAERAVKEAARTARYLRKKKLAAKEAKETTRHMRSSDAFDNRDGASSSGDLDSGVDQSEFCPSCDVRFRADGSCLC